MVIARIRVEKELNSDPSNLSRSSSLPASYSSKYSNQRLEFEHLVALNVYSGENYQAMNRFLETGNMPEGWKKEDMKKLIEDTNKGIQRLTLNTEKKTFRGTTTGLPVLENKTLGSIEKGMSFISKSFTSSSTSDLTAINFAQSSSKKFTSDPAMINIRSYLGASTENISDYPNQKEVLLPPNTEFYVLDIAPKAKEIVRRKKNKEKKEEINILNLEVWASHAPERRHSFP